MSARDRIVPVAVVAAVAAGVLVSLSSSDVGERPDTGRRHRLGESKLLALPDGGKGYGYPADLDCDGGTCTEYLVTDIAPCVRRPAGAPVESCLRREPDGGARDFGESNRFPRDEAVGAGCEGVACSVVAGEDSIESEDVRLAWERSKRP